MKKANELDEGGHQLPQNPDGRPYAIAYYNINQIFLQDKASKFSLERQSAPTDALNASAASSQQVNPR